MKLKKAKKLTISYKVKVKKNMDNIKFTVVIPTQWNLKNISNFEHFLNILDKSKYVGEIILIDNDNKNIKIDLSKYKKIKHIINNENIFVNPSWNLGYSLHNYEYKLILANDDLKIYDDNIDIIFDMLSKTTFEIVGLSYRNDNINVIEKIDNFPSKNYGSFLYVKKYYYIPEQLKIWAGDDYQFQNVSIGKRGILKTNLIQNTENRIMANKSYFAIGKKDRELYNKIVADYNKLNVIIRTSGRPNYFKDCVDSVKALYTPDEIKFHITIDDYKDLEYVKENLNGYDYNYYLIDREKVEKICENIKIIRRPRLENYYFNIIKPFLKGWCFYLDDDDKNISKINVKKLDSNKIYIARAIVNGRELPNSKNFGRNVVINDISTLCIICHSSKIVDWTPQCGGDYYFISEMYKKYECVWVDEVLSSVQDHLGKGSRIDKKNYTHMEKNKLLEKNLLKLAELLKNNKVVRLTYAERRYLLNWYYEQSGIRLSNRPCDVETCLLVFADKTLNNDVQKESVETEDSTLDSMLEEKEEEEKETIDNDEEEEKILYKPTQKTAKKKKK